MLDGKLRQTGTHVELFYQPADSEVSRFLGCTNFIHGKIHNGLFESDFASYSTSIGNLPEVIAVIRSEDIVLPAAEIKNGTIGRVVQVQFEGSTTSLTIKVDNKKFTALSLRPAFIKEQSIWLHFPPSDYIFPPECKTMKVSADPFDHYLTQVKNYLHEQCWDDVALMAELNFTVTQLAKGEYNLNYLLESAGTQLVYRVNMASQINRDDQIIYEYKALQLLERSGVTPIPYFVDDSRTLIDRGISIMEYLPGYPLDYHLDLANAAKALAMVHQTEVPPLQNHLIVEKQPLSLIYKECVGLLKTYFQSNLATPEICSFLHEVVDWAGSAKTREQYFLDDPWLCIVNTEVNSANFIVNRTKQTTHLIDWEMPRWGDPSTDLCHFCSPLTTLWKTSFQFSPESIELFINLYKQNIHSTHLRSTLEDRMRLKFPFVLLRGISWSAMAWVAYQTEYIGIHNEDTRQKLQQYMDLTLIRSLFEPFMKN